MEFDGDVWMLTVTGHIKPAHAERIIADPVQYQRFLEWYAAELNLTEHVLWIIGKQLDEREGLFPKRRAPLGMRRLTFEWRKLCQAYLAEMGDANAYRMDWNRHRGRDWLDLVDRRDF
jgi:hypothetical protein